MKAIPANFNESEYTVSFTYQTETVTLAVAVASQHIKFLY